MPSEVAARPALLDGDTVPAADWRAMLPGAIFPAAGILRGLAAAALPTPAMRVRLPAGLSLVDDTTGGFYLLRLDTQIDLDIAASSATLARIDSVIAEVVDTGVTATLKRRFRVITGTPAASPVPPSLPPADQPTAKTLRLANVFVQANAEVNGNVRAQDVTVVAPSTAVIPRPVQTLQVTDLINTNPTPGAWTDFTSGQWPPISFVVPPSGMAYVTVGAECHNETTSFSNTRVSFRLSGGYTLAAAIGRDAGGHIFTSGSRRYLVTGMTPGSSVTVTPAYRLSSVGTTSVKFGNLIVEPV